MKKSLIILCLLVFSFHVSKAQTAYNDTLWKRTVWVGLDLQNPDNEPINKLTKILTKAVKDSLINVYADDDLHYEKPNEDNPRQTIDSVKALNENRQKFMLSLGARTETLTIEDWDREGNTVYRDSTISHEADYTKIVAIIFKIELFYLMEQATIKREVTAAQPIAKKENNREGEEGDEPAAFQESGWLACNELLPVLEKAPIYTENNAVSVSMREFIAYKIQNYNDFIFQIDNAKGQAIWESNGAVGPFNLNMNTLSAEAYQKYLLRKFERDLFEKY